MTALQFARQLDCVRSSDVCERRQLTVNLGKTKIVIFETQKSACEPFFFQDMIVARQEEHRCLGFVFYATRNMTYRAGLLVS